MPEVNRMVPEGIQNRHRSRCQL